MNRWIKVAAFLLCAFVLAQIEGTLQNDIEQVNRSLDGLGTYTAFAAAQLLTGVGAVWLLYCAGRIAITGRLSR
jgi:hypothetical protein